MTVIVTSDHGESLGEHEEATHGIFAYESTLRVPLLLYYPPLVDAGTTSRAVAHVDIAPTILDMLHLPAPPSIAGRGLLAESTGDSGDGRVMYFEALSGLLNRGWAPLRGVAARRFKFIDLPVPELYDLSRDPAEARNLAASNPDEVARFRRMLAAIKDEGPAPPPARGRRVASGGWRDARPG